VIDSAVLDITYDDALAASDEAIALLRVEGLRSPNLRARSVAALRALQRAGRTTDVPKERQNLELRAGYWCAVRRVQTGQREVASIDEHDPEATPTDLPDDELERRAGSSIGLNSLYIVKRTLNVSGPRFGAVNCRLWKATVTLKVDALELPSTRTIECTFEGAAGRSVLTRALLRRTRLAIQGPTEAEIDSMRMEGGHLMLESARPVRILDSAFLTAGRQRARITLVAPALEFIDCHVGGLELLNCKIQRLTYVRTDHDDLAITGGSVTTGESAAGAST
jgi:hypothetical protein